MAESRHQWLGPNRGSKVRRLISVVASTGLILLLGFTALPVAKAGAVTPAGISGTGSSYASPAIETWVNAVHGSPYNLSLSWFPSNSGSGRYEFTNQTTDFAVSDIGYVGTTDTTPPTFPFDFVPFVGAGIAFMYNIPGLTQQLQLSSYSACGLLTGGIKSWNDPAIAADNPGVSLPNVPVIPVTESDSAGTNYALEEWCIQEQPALWAGFAQAQNSQGGGPTDGVTISGTSPNSNWPGISGGLDDQSTTGVVGDVANHSGAIGAVQVKYAEEESGFGGTDPTKNVALVKNASGDYTAPTPVDVTSALAYATQLPSGTQQLNFNGAGPHVYNPSTYSYFLTPSIGWSAAKGDTMSQFVNYVLTLGQQTAPTLGYASLGLSLEQYGVNAVQHNVPGAVPLTAAEQQAYACGDLTPTEVQAGQTTPSCGVTSPTSPVSLITGAPSGPFSSGQTIEVKVSANATLSSGSGIYIEECSAPGGVTPTSSSQCDVKTYQHNPLFAAPDGSVDYQGYPIYALPDSTTLDEPAGGSPACDLTDQCVLYVGENPTDFSLPHLWSQTFHVHPTPGDDGSDPGNGAPEVPFALALPVLAIGIFGGSVAIRRRRDKRVT
jgi:phosphate transport system substrate-binding protein